MHLSPTKLFFPKKEELSLSHCMFKQLLSKAMFQVYCRFLTVDCQVLNQDGMESKSADNSYLTVLTTRRNHLAGHNLLQNVCLKFEEGMEMEKS